MSRLGFLDADVRAFVEASERYYPPEANTWSAERNRRVYDELCEAFRPRWPEGVTSFDGLFECSTRSGGVPYRRYRWTDAPRKTTAIALYLHGGGFVVGGLESHDDVCADICARTGLEVVSVDYRLSPENVYPAALDDVNAAFVALANEGAPIVAVGDSAGGTLAAALCFRRRRVGGPMPVGQVLIYPALGPVRREGSYRERADAPMLRAEDCEYYYGLYSGTDGPERLNDPEFMPLAAEDFANLPPAWVVTADVDPLRDDGRDYCAGLQEAGLLSGWRNEPGLVHGYLRARNLSEKASASFSAIVDAICRIASPSKRSGDFELR